MPHSTNNGKKNASQVRGTRKDTRSKAQKQPAQENTKGFMKGLSSLGKKIILFLLIVIFIWPVTGLVFWGTHKIYSAIDKSSFPHVDAKVQSILENTTAQSPEIEKGIALCEVMINRMEQEMDSIFGWTVNDLIISPTSWLDNRDNRQLGTLFATRLLVGFFSTHFAKVGTAGMENEALKEAREQYFAFSADSWWFPSSEEQFNKGIREVRQYEQELRNDKAMFIVRTDSLYQLFNFIISKEFLDQPLGLLVEENFKVNYSELDDRVYYTQGVVLVLRDFLITINHLYPEIKNRGGKENIRVALKVMDKICTFNPVIVLRGDHESLFADHRSKMTRYLLNVRERLHDVAQSLSR
jgi:nitrate reductase NapE component